MADVKERMFPAWYPQLLLVVLMIGLSWQMYSIHRLEGIVARQKLENTKACVYLNLGEHALVNQRLRAEAEGKPGYVDPAFSEGAKQICSKYVDYGR